MLELLCFRDVGPAPELEVHFKKRLNFLTGDNGLGKSFILDAAWWALTRSWAGEILRPPPPPSQPKISYSYTTKASQHSSEVDFDREREVWRIPRGRPPIPGLVLYARVDGGFAVWDPARNYWKDEDPKRLAAYVFSNAAVWDGLPLDRAEKFCNGLVADWVSWQLEKGDAFEQLKRVLRKLSPSPTEPLVPGQPVKVSLTDARRHPTLVMPYGQEVPLVQASAGIRRVVALAYLLVWAWQEHLASAKLRGSEPAQEIIFLVDEIEAHLHPQWQRRVVPALLDVMEALTEAHDVPVQIVAATHSPLVLASVESRFQNDVDAVLELELREGEVELKEFPWNRQGDANSWLTSSVFELKQPRSLEAESALGRALELLRESDPEISEIRKVDQALRDSLSDTDRFWVRWSEYAESRGLSQ